MKNSKKMANIPRKRKKQKISIKIENFEENLKNSTKTEKN